MDKIRFWVFDDFARDSLDMSVYFFVKELGYQISDAIRMRQEEGYTSFIIIKFLVLVKKLGFRCFNNLARNFLVEECS